MKHKIADIDLETGGLDRDKHPVLQIAGALEIDGSVPEPFNIFVKPFPGQEITESALEKNNFELDEILAPGSKFLPPKEAFDQFVKLLENHIDRYDSADKFIFCGYNSFTFDMPFLRNFFERCGNDFFGAYFQYPSRDLLLESGAVLRSVRSELPNFQLRTVAEALGIQVDESQLHDGAYDAQLVTELRHWIDRLQSRVYSAARLTDPDAVTLLAPESLDQLQAALRQEGRYVREPRPSPRSVVSR